MGRSFQVDLNMVFSGWGCTYRLSRGSRGLWPSMGVLWRHRMIREATVNPVNVANVEYDIDPHNPAEPP
jgi:hypothetical protein